MRVTVEADGGKGILPGIVRSWTERLRALFGKASGSASLDAEYDPLYGLPRRAVEEWLARDPRLPERYEMDLWLARNPPLKEEYEAPRIGGAAPHLPTLLNPDPQGLSSVEVLASRERQRPESSGR